MVNSLIHVYIATKTFPQSRNFSMLEQELSGKFQLTKQSLQVTWCQGGFVLSKYGILSIIFFWTNVSKLSLK